MSITKYQGREIYDTKDIRTATTGEAIATARFCVKLSSGTIIKTTGPTDSAVGLAVDDYASGDQGQYITKGRLRFVAGGTIAEGNQLTPDNGTAGRVRAATTAEKVIGTAIDSASVGEFCFGEFDFAHSVVV
jgi:hypothetical protein